MSDNPFLARMAKRSGSQHGNKVEKKLAKKTKSRETLASGALEIDKGDLKFDHAAYPLLIESKSTIHASLGVKHDWLKKITKEAQAVEKFPALAVTFCDRQGNAQPQGEWVALPLWLFKEIFGDSGGTL